MTMCLDERGNEMTTCFTLEVYNPNTHTLQYQYFRPEPGQTFIDLDGDEYRIAVVTPDEVIAHPAGQGEVYRYFPVDEVCGYLTPIEVQ